MIKFDRISELKTARHRTKSIPIEIDQVYKEIVDRENADKVSKRKQRETKRKIKL